MEVCLEEMEVETLRAPEDQSGDQRMAMGYQNAQKQRTKDDVICGTSKRWTFEKRCWVQPECNNGIKEQLHLGSNRAFNKTIRQTLGLEVIKLAACSSVRSPKMSVKKLTTAQAKEETIHSLRATDV
jgi:hypothetical protein